MSATRFWTTSSLAAISFGLIAGLLFPYGALGIESAAERTHAWLLTLWTAGVMAICFGAGGLLMAVAPIGFKDVYEAGSVARAIEDRKAQRASGASFYNFAGWTVSLGSFLLLIYFAAWLATRR